MELTGTWREVRRLTKVGAFGAIFGALIFAANSFGNWLQGDIPEVLFVFVALFSTLWASSAASERSHNPGLTHAQSLGWRFISLYPIICTIGLVWALLVKLPPFHFLASIPAESTLRIGALLPLLLGISMLISSVPRPGRVRNMLDAAITSSSVAVFSWHFVIAPVWGALRFRLLSDWSLLASPIGAAFVVFVSLTLVFAAASIVRWRSGVVAIGVGALFIAVADNGNTLEMLKRSNLPAWFELFWPLGIACFAIAAHCWPATSHDVSDMRDELKRSVNRTRALLSLIGPYIVAVGSFGVVAEAELSSNKNVGTVTFLMGGFLMVLVIARQITTFFENLILADQVTKFNADLEQIVERRTAQLNALYSLSKAVGNSLDIEGVLRNSADHAIHALGGEAVITNVTPFAFLGVSSLTEFVRHSGLEQDLWVLDQLNILEASWAPVSGQIHDKTFKRHAKYVLAPILSKGRNFGWIAVIRWNESFDQSDGTLLEGVASEVGTALENARLYDVAKQMADIDSVTGVLNHRAAQERFDFAFAHAKDMNEPFSVLMVDINNFKFFNDTYGHLAGDQVLKSIAKAMRNVTRPHDVIARYGGDEFLIILPNSALADATALAECLMDRVAQEGYPEPGSDRVIPYSVSIGTAAFPETAKTRNEMLYQADSEMYKVKRSESASAPVKKAIRKPSSTTGETFDLLDSMINAVDNKDYYTRAHSEEFTEYALWIATELGLSEEARKTIRYAGLLHDVGKIGIPDEILRKPGHLSDEEYDVMKQHPVVGAMIVSSMPGMSDILPGVKYHHERWDGKGYPEGLAGENIPMLGRLLAVPDTFSAMTTDRPYRKGMSQGVALAKIKEGAGTQFDPTIVEAFSRALAKRVQPEESESVAA
ncbi:MAG: diguanylate cyclase [Fimbriimonadaceae bacterium]